MIIDNPKSHLLSSPVPDFEVVVSPITFPSDFFQVGHALVDLVQPLFVGHDFALVLVGLQHRQEHVALFEQDEPVLV